MTGFSHLTNGLNRLQITADFSHWMVGCERLLDISEEDRNLMDAVIPHVSNKDRTKINSISMLTILQVGHIHARIGTTQASQCPEPLNPVFKQERQCMERLWTKIIQSQVKRNGPNASIIFVPEYG